MKLMSIFAILFLCLLTQLSGGAFASSSNNGWSSSGGDDVPNSVGAAWFLGDTPLTYCIERNPTFSLKEKEVIAIVDSAIVNWKNYYQKNKAQLNPNSAQINFNLSAGKCDGKESLKIMLGVNPAEVAHEKPRYYNPFGFAVLQNYNLETNLGHGFIWLADPAIAYPLAHQKSFYGMVLHELGHVFGNEHVDNTIMSSKITQIISEITSDAGFPSDDPSFDKIFTQIDGKRSLFFSYLSLNTYSGLIPSLEEAKLLTGRAFSGNLTGTFSNLGPNANYILKICDQVSCSTLPVAFIGQGTVQTNPVPVFKTSTKSGVEASYSKSYEGTGLIKGANGAYYTVLITLNMGDQSQARIQLINGAQPVDLFVQVPITSR